MRQQVVVDNSGKVLRFGSCDFSSDGSFRPDKEKILVEGTDFVGRFKPEEDIRKVAFFYRSGTKTFEK